MIFACLVAGCLVACVLWVIPKRPTDYTPGRPLENLNDMALELQRIATLTTNKMTFRGVFTKSQLPAISPPLRPLDLFIVYDPAAVTYTMVLQLTTVKRLRAEWTVTVKAA